MINISKNEMFALREKFGDDIHISITNRNKKGGRKKYFAEESSKVLSFIERYRKNGGI